MQVPQQKQLLEEELETPDISLPFNIMLYSYLTIGVVMGLKQLIMNPEVNVARPSEYQAVNRPPPPILSEERNYVTWHSTEIPSLSNLQSINAPSSVRWESYKGR